MHEIVGKNVILRPITDADTPNILLWRNSDWVMKHFIQQTKYTVESQTRWMREYIDTGKAIQFIIHIPSEGRDVGTAYVRDLDKYDKEGEYGIFLGVKDISVKGIGSEVGSLVIDYCFKEMGLKRLFSRILASNPRSVKMCEKMNMFVYEEIPGGEIINGVPVDIVMVEIKNPEVVNE